MYFKGTFCSTLIQMHVLYNCAKLFITNFWSMGHSTTILQKICCFLYCILYSNLYEIFICSKFFSHTLVVYLWRLCGWRLTAQQHVIWMNWLWKPNTTIIAIFPIISSAVQITFIKTTEFWLRCRYLITTIKKLHWVQDLGSSKKHSLITILFN
jgi:hypothetical protein